MIFAETINLAMSGRKTQTCRLQYAGDRMLLMTDGAVLVQEASGRTRWEVGKLYAIQPERRHFAQGYFRCTYLRDVPNPLLVDEAFARAEGFDSLGEFLDVWRKLHAKAPTWPCWAIGMELVKP